MADYYKNAAHEKKSSSGAGKVIAKIFYYVIIGLLLVLLLANVYSILARFIFKQSVPKVFGFAYQIVLTDSMNGDKPDSFSAGTLILIKEQDNYSVGDIITFQTYKQVVDDSSSGSGAALVTTTTPSEITTTHRIIEIVDGKFKTKGDWNNAADIDLVDPSDVQGKVIYKSFNLGRIAQFLTSTMGMILIIAVGFLIIFVPSQISRKNEEDDSPATAHRTKRENIDDGYIAEKERLAALQNEIDSLRNNQSPAEDDDGSSRD